MTTASVVKLEIMSGILLRAQTEGRGLTEDERNLIWPMITQSADAPASTLFRRLGGAPGMDSISQAFGMTNTFSSDPLWGLTLTTAADQVRLARQVIAGEFGPLSSPYRAEARSFAGNVVPEQRWGVGTGVPGGWASFQKNGFASSFCCGWRVNSVGWVERPGGSGWAIAILTDGWASEAEGKPVVDALGERVNRYVVGSPFGAVDRLVATSPDRFRVSGWLADPSDNAPIDVVVYVDNTLAAFMTANLSRPDVANAYPAFGPNHGYDATFTVPDGTHVVCVYAINNGPPAPNRQLLCHTVTVLVRPIGSLDAAMFAPGGIRVAGWAIDPDTANPIVVHVYVGSAGFNIGVANTSRPDVGSAYPGFGSNHGTTP